MSAPSARQAPKTADDVRRVLNQLVEDAPERTDFRPPGALSARYVDNSRPHSLVGRILHSLGVSISTLRQLDREREGNDVTLVESRHAIKNHFTRSAWLLLVHLQRLSDQGLRWVNIKDEALQQLPASVGASTIAITRPWLVEP